jgi:hypothetical protein
MAKGRFQHSRFTTGSDRLTDTLKVMITFVSKSGLLSLILIPSKR